MLAEAEFMKNVLTKRRRKKKLVWKMISEVKY